MEPFITVFLTIFCLQFGYVYLFENALLILGGGSKVFITKQDQSPVLDDFELFGCSDGTPTLPPYPFKMFGPSMVFDGEKTLWVCGGANWQGPLDACYSWDARYVCVGGTQTIENL